MNLSKITSSLSLLFVLIALSALCGCSSNDDYSHVDYAKLRLTRMDITDAASLGLRSISQSRSIDGEYLRPGLYKIDDDGNISAVVVYFTTDTLGNRLEHEESLQILPEHVHNITENFIIVTDCKYFDCDGDVVSGHQYVPYENLLVRKSDGKIWCIDNAIKYISFERDNKFKQNSKGDLFYTNYTHVFKFILNGDSASFAQLTKNSLGGLSTFNVNDRDIVWCKGRDFWSPINISWPFSGFQEIQVSLEGVIDELEKDLGTVKYHYPCISNYSRTNSVGMSREACTVHLASIKGEPYVVIGIRNHWYYYHKDGTPGGWGSCNECTEISKSIRAEKMWPEVACLAKLVIGDTPGSAYIDKSSLSLIDNGIAGSGRNDEFKFEVSSVYSTADHILTSSIGDNDSWVSVIDLKTMEWKWLKQVPYELSFDVANEYGGRIWTINYKKGSEGFYWIDLSDLSDGFTKINGSLPDYMTVINHVNKNGTVLCKGINPATGDTEELVIDLMTGELIDKSITEPQMIFETIISLN